jgi:hypothetical protein
MSLGYDPYYLYALFVGGGRYSVLPKYCMYGCGCGHAVYLVNL